MSTSKPKGWHSRGYHPHLDAAGEIQTVGIRLNDSIPAKLLEQWRNELRKEQLNFDSEHQSQISRKLIRRILKFEDTGYGSCILRNPACAEIVIEALHFHDGTRYRLIEWCVMPNHVHVIFEQLPEKTLGQIVRTWKSYTTLQINRLRGTHGGLWMKDYFDRYIRDEEHLADARAYVRNNPVKAGLCARPEDWPHGSAA